jgi:hypothetical protein
MIGCKTGMYAMSGVRLIILALFEFEIPEIPMLLIGILIIYQGNPPPVGHCARSLLC